MRLYKTLKSEEKVARKRRVCHARGGDLDVNKIYKYVVVKKEETAR